ncbi:MAG: polymer-forming cytoskeletal protein [Deltaproteobacteria bacterium]|nr:polymer-forming cytoskeletal protein [Deltaproteobacteria bacterium]
MPLFKKEADMSRLDTLIGNGTIFEGSLTSKESICVEGLVRGKIVCEGSVIVGEKGRVDADIFADSVLLGGEVNGNIVAKTKLEITTSGKLRGDIKTGSLIIAEGVLFEGKCQMITEERGALPSPEGIIENEEIQVQ